MYEEAATCDGHVYGEREHQPSDLVLQADVAALWMEQTE